MRHNGMRTKMSDQQLMQGLGWFSIGLGLMQILAPRKLSRSIGVNPHPMLMRALGMRELASGIGILTQRKPANWLWSRVAGDAMDLSLLGAALSSDDTHRGRAAMATAAVAGVTALDVIASQRMTLRPEGKDRRIQVRTSVIVNRPAEELYEFWQNFENFPRFMNHLESVKVQDERHSHWVAKGPAGTTVEWDAEITHDRPNQVIAWRSLPGSDVINSGSVRFETATGGRGTLVRVEMQYYPPGGVLGATVAKLFGEAPEKQMKVDLYRFKQLVETGEVARTEGQPAGRPKSTSTKFDDLVRK